MTTHTEQQQTRRIRQLAIELCDADDSMTHHDQTDDHPCTMCLRYARTVEPILTQRINDNTQFHIDMHHAYRPEVVAEVAVHLGSHEDWEHLAQWTGGRIHTDQDPSGEYTSTLVLPNGEAGGEWAWLVLNHAGEFHIRTEVAAPTIP